MTTSTLPLRRHDAGRIYLHRVYFLGGFVAAFGILLGTTYAAEHQDWAVSGPVLGALLGVTLGRLMSGPSLRRYQSLLERRMTIEDEARKAVVELALTSRETQSRIDEIMRTLSTVGVRVDGAPSVSSGDAYNPVTDDSPAQTSLFDDTRDDLQSVS